ncbi:MAG: hypothetical protein OXC92_02925 [Flavobacteriaceae bacterium]|nr:hypothetical protein [Flavobacteriaceae bacterium]MCY4215922.1 hypothetical protein [Flavobacteriaceae bacterium]MCY4253813.1 hypothetical protein [Flavobacteriaceae bacterium]
MDLPIDKILQSVEETSFIPWIFIVTLVAINVINSLIPGIFYTLTQILQLQKLVRTNTELIPKTISFFTLTNLMMLVFIVSSASLYLSFTLSHLSRYPISLQLYWWFFIPIFSVIVLRFLLNIVLLLIFKGKPILIDYINSRIPVHFSLFMYLLIICFMYYTIIESWYFLLIGGSLFFIILGFNEFKLLQKFAKENAIRKVYIIIYICILRLLPWYGVFALVVQPIM